MLDKSFSKHFAEFINVSGNTKPPDRPPSFNILFSSIEMLAEKLNMNINDAERWIVNLIKNARLDAKIDSKRGHVVMSDQATNPHQQVIDKTKNLQVFYKLGQRGNSKL